MNPFSILLPWFKSLFVRKPGIINGVIQTDGETVSNKDIDNNPSVLFNVLTSAQLEKVEDPAYLLNKRVEAQQPPTKAFWVDAQTKRVQAPVNPQSLATFEQSKIIARRLGDLGFVANDYEMKMENPFSYVDFNGDTRRFYYVGPFQVGALVNRYAKYPKETADAMTKAEFGG